MILPEVVAVVLNWRDFDSTRTCVTSLLAETAISRVIVVDNESTGQLRPLANENVDLIELHENAGFSRGVNVGIKRALESGAEAVFAINNDAVLREGSVDRLLGEWERVGFGDVVLAPIVLNPDGSEQSTGGRFRSIDCSTNDLATDGSIDYLTWACVFLPRGVLQRVGLLDEGFFMYWEDVEFGLRVSDAGIPLQVVSSAAVEHAKSASHAKAGASIDRYSARGVTVLARRRGGLVWAGAVYRILGRALDRALHGRGGNAVAILRGFQDGLKAKGRAPRV